MNFIKRAWITLWAKKGRSLLLVLTSAVILVFVMAGLIIQNAALSSAQTAANSVGSTVTLSTNREAAFKAMQSSSSSSSSSDSSSSTSTTNSRPQMVTYTTSVENVKKIAALSNVASYNITNSASVNAKSFSAVTSTTSTSSNRGMGMPGGESTSTGDISISGVSTTAATSTFSSGSATITSGRGIKASDEGTTNTVISQELAKANNLSVGDSITVTYTDSSSNTQTVTLKIVGIYKTSTSADTFRDPSNTIYTSYTFANTVSGTEGEASNVTFTMSDSSDTSAFIKAAKKYLNTNQMSLTSDEAAYKQIAAQMKTISSFANKIVWVVSIAGVLILGLIIILITRERRREIGVLVSLGESKVKVVGQLFTELLIVLMLGLGIATAAGSAVSSVVTKQLASQQTTASQSTNQGAPGGGQNSGGPQGGGMGGGMMSAAVSSSTTKFSTAVTPIAVAELGAVAVAIAVVSVSGAAVNILRMRPKRILQDD
jgi:putative ABC transport system permease protein